MHRPAPRSAAEVVLLAPGLLGLPGPAAGALRIVAEDLDLDATRRFLSRSRSRPAPWQGPSLERMLFEAFSIDVADGDTVPVAAVTAHLDGVSPGDDWIARADPVHLHAGLTDLEVRDPGGLDLGRDDAERLARRVNTHAAERGWTVEVGAPSRWYVRLPGAPRVETMPLPEAVGRRIGDLFAGDDAPAWRRDLNEVQMLLHDAAPNVEREAAGRLTVNSLWLWGGGRLPRPPARAPWDAVFADDPLATGLARLCGCDVAPLPRDGAGGPLAAPGRTLVVLDGGRRALAGGDLDAWRSWLAAADAGWLEPLLEQAARRGLASLLVTGPGPAFALGRREARRWWRRSRPFADFLPPPAG